jgi:hypothetical protein
MAVDVAASFALVGEVCSLQSRAGAEKAQEFRDDPRSRTHEHITAPPPFGALHA